MRLLRTALVVLATLMMCGSTLPQAYVNRDTGALISLAGAGAGTTFTSDMLNYQDHAAKCLISITAIAAGSLTVTIYGKDNASGNYYTLLASAALASAGTTVLSVGPGLTTAGNTVANDYLPAIWRIGATVVTGPVTATVGCSLIQ